MVPMHQYVVVSFTEWPVALNEIQPTQSFVYVST